MKIHSVENIIMIDDFFDDEEILNLENWAYLKKNYSITMDRYGKMFSFASFQTDGYENFDDVTKNILDKLKEQFPFPIPNFQRCLINCLGLNQFCEMHVDADSPGGLSIIIYLNSEWKLNWAGETYYCNGLDADYAISVIPKPGRIVIAPSDVWHGSRSPSQFMESKFRLTLVFQYERLDQDSIFYTTPEILNTFIDLVEGDQNA
jgi:hypothetical protein